MTVQWSMPPSFQCSSTHNQSTMTTVVILVWCVCLSAFSLALFLALICARLHEMNLHAQIKQARATISTSSSKEY